MIAKSATKQAAKLRPTEEYDDPHLPLVHPVMDGPASSGIKLIKKKIRHPHPSSFQEMT